MVTSIGLAAADPGGGGGGSWGSGLPPPFWGTPKLHKEGKTQYFST